MIKVSNALAALNADLAEFSSLALDSDSCGSHYVVYRDLADPMVMIAIDSSNAEEWPIVVIDGGGNSFMFALDERGEIRERFTHRRASDLLASALVFSFLDYGYFAPSYGFSTAWLAGTTVIVVVLALVTYGWAVKAGYRTDELDQVVRQQIQMEEDEKAAACV